MFYNIHLTELHVAFHVVKKEWFTEQKQCLQQWNCTEKFPYLGHCDKLSGVCCTVLQHSIYTEVMVANITVLSAWMDYRLWMCIKPDSIQCALIVCIRTECTFIQSRSLIPIHFWGDFDLDWSGSRNFTLCVRTKTSMVCMCVLTISTVSTLLWATHCMYSTYLTHLEKQYDG